VAQACAKERGGAWLSLGLKEGGASPAANDGGPWAWGAQRRSRKGGSGRGERGGRMRAVVGGHGPDWEERGWARPKKNRNFFYLFNNFQRT
jgi:hypothetical protein